MTDQPDQQVFRSPASVVIWWVWALFAAGNLIDLAVQGRDHLALTAAFVLLLVTGVVYVTALRPRLVAGPDELVIVNPFNDHRVSWAAVSRADPADLLRIRCEWQDGDRARQRSFYVWAVHSSRRRQVAAEMRAQRQACRGSGAGGFGSFGGGGSLGWSPGAAAPAPDPDALRVDPDKVIALVTERAGQAREDVPGTPAAPASAWHWPAVAAVVVPGIALLVAALT
ncbi:MAG TPA: hypothetical protein VGD91_29285 [Trebonia sp.]